MLDQPRVMHRWERIRLSPGKEALVSKLLRFVAALAGTILAGCDYFKAPKMAIPTNPVKPVSLSQSSKLPVKRPTVKKYMGKTSEEWGQTLTEPDPEHVRMASVALRVLGAEGRP